MKRDLTTSHLYAIFGNFFYFFVLSASIAHANNCGSFYIGSLANKIIGRPEMIQSSNISHTKAKYIRDHAGFEEAPIGYTLESKAAFFSNVKIGEQLIIESWRNNYESESNQTNTNYFIVTSNIVFNSNRTVATFEVYDFTSNRTKPISLDISDMRIRLWHKPMPANIRLEQNESGFINAFQKRGYKWTGENANFTELYNQLRTGDELVFLNFRGEIQRLVMTGIDFGVKQFLDLTKPDDAFYVIGYGSAGCKGCEKTFTPSELQQFVNPNKVLIRRNSKVPPKSQIDPNWSSSVDMIKSTFSNSQESAMHGINDSRFAANPAKVTSEIHMAQMAVLHEQTTVARLDLSNIKAIRNMDDRATFVPGRVELKTIKTEEGSQDIRDIVGKDLEFDAQLKTESGTSRYSAKIEEASEPNTYYFKTKVSSKAEALGLYAHLLESSYGSILDSAGFVNRNKDTRIDLDMLSTLGVWVSKSSDYRSNDKPEKRLFRATTTGNEATGYTLVVEVTDNSAILSYQSSFINGLIWGHNLRIREK